MRKLIIGLGLAGVVLFTVVLVLALVRAPFDPARMIKRKLFPSRAMMYEARIQLSLVRELDDIEMEKLLKEENTLIDSEEFLAPLVRELGLTEAWKLPDEGQAVAKLRGQSEIRRGELPTSVVLAARDQEEAGAGRLIQAISKAYMSNRQAARAADNGESGGF